MNDALEVCRTCMNEFTEKFQPVGLDSVESALNPITLRQKLEAFAPELDLNLGFSSVICKECVAAIDFIHKFKRKCLETEECIQNYMGQFSEQHEDSFLKIVDVQTFACETALDDLPNGIALKVGQKGTQLDIPVCNQSHIQKDEQSHLELVDCGSVLFNTDNDIEINEEVKQESISVVSPEVTKDEISDDCGSVLFNTNNDIEIKEEVKRVSINNACVSPPGVTNDEISNDCSSVLFNTDNDIEINEEVERESIKNACEVPPEVAKDEISDASNNNCKYNYTIFRTLNMTRNRRTDLYKCNNCPYNVTYNSSISDHMKNHLKKTSYQCEQCDFKSSIGPVLIAHAHNHKEKLTCKCSECAFATAFVSRVISRKKVRKWDKLYSCVKCSYVTSNDANINSHLEGHPVNGCKKRKQETNLKSTEDR